MKPAAFEYYAPSSVEEAVALLDRHRPAARVLAGGQSLVPLMNFRRERPRVLVDVNRVEELFGIREEEGALLIGAMTRQSTIEGSEVVARRCPILTEATRHIGHRAVRNRGTFGGSLAFADPGAEYPTVFLALDGEVAVRSPEGARVVAAGDLFVDSFQTSLEPGELLVQARVPALGERRWAFLEISRRHHTHTIASVAVVAGLGEGGRLRDVRVALGGVGATPLRTAVAEERLEGEAPGEEAFAEAAAAAAAELTPRDELHAPASYKRAVAQALICRALRRALPGEGD